MTNTDPEFDRASARVDSMNLSDSEVRHILDYLTGYNPAAVNAALDFTARRRADAIRRAASLLEA